MWLCNRFACCELKLFKIWLCVSHFLRLLFMNHSSDCVGGNDDDLAVLFVFLLVKASQSFSSIFSFLLLLPSSPSSLVCQLRSNFSCPCSSVLIDKLEFVLTTQTLTRTFTCWPVWSVEFLSKWFVRSSAKTRNWFLLSFFLVLFLSSRLINGLFSDLSIFRSILLKSFDLCAKLL